MALARMADPPLPPPQIHVSYRPTPTGLATIYAQIAELQTARAPTPTPAVSPTLELVFETATPYVAPSRLVMTQSEYLLLGHLMWLEAGGLGIQGMQSVASTVRARLLNYTRWGDTTVTDVILRGCPNFCQFGPAPTALKRTQSEQALHEWAAQALNAYLIWDDSPWGCFGYESFSAPGNTTGDCVIALNGQSMGWRNP